LKEPEGQGAPTRGFIKQR